MKLWHKKQDDEVKGNFPSEQERLITHGLERLRDATAREIMTPRVDVVALEAPVSVRDVIAAVRRSGHSHFPVYDGDLDRLRGILFVKDLFHLEPRVDAKNESIVLSEDLDVTKTLREPYIVPESRSALEILADMRRRRRGFSIVVDEHGGFAGALTINDLVSELVGELRDEFDRSVDPSIVRIDATRYLVDGACAVSDVRDELNIAIPDGEYVTLGGYLFDVFGHVPEEGEIYDHDGWRFVIAQMDRRRVAKVVVEAPSSTLLSAAGPIRPTGK